MDNLNYLSTDKIVVVYWDKPADADENTSYSLYVDGVLVQKTSKTHCTFENLASDTEYEIKVERDDNHDYNQFLCHTKSFKNRIDIADKYGLCPDGKTLNTKAFQKAFDECTENDELYLKKGIYLTGALRMHSDMVIYLEEGAVIQGTTALEDYAPKIHSRFEGYEMECYQSLLNLGTLDHNAGYNCENVIIYGKGQIYGGGAALAKNIAASEAARLKDYIESLGDKIKEYEKPETIANRARGRLINMSNCRNIWIHGLKLGKAPSWNVHFIYSDRIYTDACEFYSQGIWNGDGWDPDSSTNSAIFNCRFYTEDDSVAIKSGKNPEGNVINRPTENIRVFDCVTAFGHGICIGSEMSGGIENIKIWDCEVGPTWSGIEIKGTKKRGGYVRNVEVRDITASHIQVHSVLYNDDGEGAPFPPIFENCSFTNIKLLGRYLDNNAGKDEWHDCVDIDLQGFDEEGYHAKNMVFRNIVFEGHKKEIMEHINMKYCDSVSFENLKEL